MANEKYEAALELPKAFIEKAVDIIVSSAIPVASKAAEEYSAPTKHWFWGLIYQHTRDPDVFSNIISNIFYNTNYYERLQKIKLLIELSEGAFCDALLAEIIKETPKQYERLSGELRQYQADALKEAILKGLDKLAKECKFTQDAAAKRDAERDAINKRTQQRFAAILICNNIPEAQEAVRSQKDKLVFCLFKETIDSKELTQGEKKEQWHFSLLDTEGKEHSLELSTELCEHIKAKEIADVKGLFPIYLNPIKTQCVLAREAYLKSKSVLWHPQQSDKALSEQYNSVFVVKKEDGQNTLWWINSLGVMSETKIDLSAYAEISKLLAYDSLTDEQTLQLKFCLLAVDVTQCFDKDRASELDGQIVGTLHIRAEKIRGNTIDNMRIELNPPQTDNELVALGRRITFIIRPADKGYSLTWINYKGLIKTIKLHAYEEFDNWLNQHTLGEIKQQFVQLKRYLADVDTINGAAVIQEEAISPHVLLQKAKERAREQVQVLIDPEELLDEDLISQGIRSTFVLRQMANNYMLSWLNNSGGAKSINLDKYLELGRWLKERSLQQVKEEMVELKGYLIDVNVANTVDSGKKKMLEELFASKFGKATTNVSTTEVADSLAPTDVLAEKKPVVLAPKLDMKNFGALLKLHGLLAHSDEDVVREKQVPELIEDYRGQPGGAGL